MDPLILEFRLLGASCHGYWEVNSGSLEEKKALLTPEPPLRLLWSFYFIWQVIWEAVGTTGKKIFCRTLLSEGFMLFFKKTEKEKGKTHILMETFYLVFFLWLQDVGEKLLSSSPECNPSLSSLRFVFSPHALPLIMCGGGHVCVCSR